MFADTLGDKELMLVYICHDLITLKLKCLSIITVTFEGKTVEVYNSKKKTF